MTTVAELFKAAGVSYGGVVRWGQPPSERGPGIYVVSSSENADQATGLDAAPLDTAAVSTLVGIRPEASIDGSPATEARLQTRLREMWVPNEPVLYVGLAGASVRARVRQYYNTKIGARAPHAGGWPIRMLDQAALWVHFGPAQDPDAAEMLMLRHFEEYVPLDTRATLIDQRTALPFANLTHPRGLRKRHGLAGVKASRAVAHRTADGPAVV
nr:hypothetical protein [uncultured Microbacterium sp.]